MTYGSRGRLDISSIDTKSEPWLYMRNLLSETTWVMQVTTEYQASCVKKDSRYFAKVYRNDRATMNNFYVYAIKTKINILIAPKYRNLCAFRFVKCNIATIIRTRHENSKIQHWISCGSFGDFVLNSIVWKYYFVNLNTNFHEIQSYTFHFSPHLS